jgi:hypothetical protein
MPIPSNAFVGHVSAGLFAREDAMACSCARQVGDRGELHQLGGRSRRQAGRNRHLSSADSSWEHLVSNSPKSANRVTRLYSVPGRASGVGSRDRRDIVHDGLMRAPGLDRANVRSRLPAVTRPDRPDSAPWWSSILAFFLEGFALYAASYCASPHVIATSRLESSPMQANDPPPEAPSWRERRTAIIVVSSSTRSGAREAADDAN